MLNASFRIKLISAMAMLRDNRHIFQKTINIFDELDEVLKCCNLNVALEIFLQKKENIYILSNKAFLTLFFKTMKSITLQKLTVYEYIEEYHKQTNNFSICLSVTHCAIFKSIQ